MKAVCRILKSHMVSTVLCITYRFIDFDKQASC